MKLDRLASGSARPVAGQLRLPPGKANPTVLLNKDSQRILREYFFSLLTKAQDNFPHNLN